ncbi:unnamed protein product, partial [Phaeothamnion confervicola]
ALDRLGLRWGPFHVAWETRLLNARLHALGSKRRSRRALRSLYAAGAVVVTFTSAASVVFLLHNLSNAWAAVLSTAGGQGGSGFVVPPVAVPPARAPCFWAAVIVAFSVHEVGHALAAVANGLRVYSVGVFVTAIFPGTFVHVEDLLRFSSPTVQLHVYAAGVWHNLLLCVVCWLAERHWAAPYDGLFYATGHGVVITGVQPWSPLADAINPGAVVVRANGMHVGNALDLAAAIESAVRPATNEVFEHGASTITAAPEELWLSRGFCMDAGEATLLAERDDHGDNCCDSILHGGGYAEAGGRRCFVAWPQRSADNGANDVAVVPLGAATDAGAGYGRLASGMDNQAAVCLPAHGVAATSRAHCDSSNVCGRDGVCWRPLGEFDEVLLTVQLGDRRIVLFEGQPRTMLSALRTSDAQLRGAAAAPAMLRWGALAAETARDFWWLLLQASASLAIANAVPCALLDGGAICHQVLRLGRQGGSRGGGGEGDGELGIAWGDDDNGSSCRYALCSDRVASAVVWLGTALLASNVLACLIVGGGAGIGL